MIVTRIAPQKKNQVLIYLNDAPAFWLTREEADACHLAEGLELTDDAQQVILMRFVLRHAQTKISQILEVRDKTERELARKLQEDHFPAEIIDLAVEDARSHHYVDDLRYAVHYLETRAQAKSRMQLRFELKERGISETILEEALSRMDAEEGDEDTEIAAILRWAGKKHYDSETASYEETQKLIAFLQRKGFPYSKIKKALT